MSRVANQKQVYIKNSTQNAPKHAIFHSKVQKIRGGAVTPPKPLFTPYLSPCLGASILAPCHLTNAGLPPQLDIPDLPLVSAFGMNRVIGQVHGQVREESLPPTRGVRSITSGFYSKFFMQNLAFSSVSSTLLHKIISKQRAVLVTLQT